MSSRTVRLIQPGMRASMALIRQLVGVSVVMMAVRVVLILHGR